MISSDAFLPPADDLNDQIVSTVIHHLHSVLIPKVVGNINNVKTTLVDCNDLKTMMHQKGISLLYLGEMYDLCEIQYAKSIIITLMAMEVLKRQMRGTKSPSTSVSDFEDKVRHGIDFLTMLANPEDDTLQKELISSINTMYHTNLKMIDFQSVPAAFLQDQLQSTLNTKMTVNLSVPDKFVDLKVVDNGITSKMTEIYGEWKALEESFDSNTDLSRFVEWSDVLLKGLEALFPGHFLCFQIQQKMCAMHKKLDDDSCSMFTDLLETATSIFGAEHPQTLSVAVELAELKQSADASLLDSVKRVFGRTSSAASIVVDVLSKQHFAAGEYDSAIDFLKDQISILDERKSFGKDEYLNLHLRIALIAERKKDYAMAIRFLNKLYHYLKKRIPTAKQQYLWKNVDIKMVCLLMSRLKLMTANEQKSKDILKKLKTRKEVAKQNDDGVVGEYAKLKQVLLQNLCANPIQKTNDLMKNSAEIMAVACWVNIITEFESNFLSSGDNVMSTNVFRVLEK